MGAEQGVKWAGWGKGGARERQSNGGGGVGKKSYGSVESLQRRREHGSHVPHCSAEQLDRLAHMHPPTHPPTGAWTVHLTGILERGLKWTRCHSTH